MPPLARLLSKLVVVIGLALLAVFSLWDNGPSHALQWPWYLYAQLMLLAPAAWLAGRALTGAPFVRFGGAIDWALGSFAGLQLLAAWFSPFREPSIASLPVVLLPVSLGYALLNGRAADPAGERARRLHAAVALGTAAVCVAGMFWWLADDVGPALETLAPWRALSLRNLHPLGHWNFTSATGLLGLAWSLPLVLRSEGRARLGWSAAALVAALALLTGASRGALLGLGVVAFIVLFAEARRRRWSRGRMLGGAALALCVVGAAGLAHPRGRALLQEFRTTGTFNSGDRQRIAMVEAGVLIVRDHPWLGIGPGATARVYPEYRARVSGGVEAALQLHSTPVQLAVDGGVLALAAFVAGFGLIGWRAWRRAADDPAALAACATLAGYGVFALTDYQLDVPWFGVALAAAAALGADRGESCARPRLLGWSVAALTAVFLTLQSGAWTGRAAFSRALDELFGMNAAGYEAQIAESFARAPRETLYRNLHGLLLLDPAAYRVPADLGPAGERFARGRAALEESLRINPAQETARFNLGWALLERDPAAAAEHFAAAARLVPDKGGVYFGLGLARLAQGRTEDAIAAWALELVNDPAFCTSPAWHSPRLQPHARAVRAAAAERLAQLAAAAPPHDPLGYARRARFAAALLRWLEGDEAAGASAIDDAEPAARACLHWLRREPFEPAAAPAPLRQLAEAIDAGPAADSATRLAGLWAQLRPPVDAGTGAALTLLARSADRRAIVRTDALDPRLVFTSRRERAGYGLLMKNLDAPTVRDLYLVQENRFVHEFLQPLFPEKGFLPGPVLAGLQVKAPR